MINRAIRNEQTTFLVAYILTLVIKMYFSVIILNFYFFGEAFLFVFQFFVYFFDFFIDRFCLI